MKTYVIMLSKHFPVKHPNAGLPTFFRDKVLAAVFKDNESWQKVHTIRANYPLWAKRFAQIEAGKAILSVRYWTGKPYASKQMEICKLTKADGIGLQKLQYFRGSLFYPSVEGTPNECNIIAANDGLSLDDWKDWFKSYDLSKPLAIIHFTPFRYN